VSGEESGKRQGSLVVVGTGLKLAGQCTLEARSWINTADVVYSMASNIVMQKWIETLNPNTISLQNLYHKDRRRSDTYQLMTSTIVDAVRSGNLVCAVFYGHPGFFVRPSHQAITQLRKEGYQATMLPGISAEDCLFADLGIDPGAVGCQSYEAQDFFLYARQPDTTAAMILWQLAFVGDRTLLEFESDPKRLKLLVDVLLQRYPGGHLVTLYEAATIPIFEPRMEVVRLDQLHLSGVTSASTLYIPPLHKPTKRID
jgi:uroporphyrin-III C-methyltransferase